ncbi:MAG TPA: hypothetical protein VL025_04725 [Thermoanaerobaculia bacterium]|nr:hypothetical protein [Thermoanaerobaculia bacterium]
MNKIRRVTGYSRPEPRALSALVVIVAGLVAASCWQESGMIDFYECSNPCLECDDPCGSCPGGECVSFAPIGWDGPLLLWSGPEGAAPPCPDRAPQLVYQGWAGLDASHVCSSCACDPPACGHPGLLASSQPCPGGGEETPFPSPPGWTGTCTSPTVLAAGDVGSVDVAPLAITPCRPHLEPEPDIPELGGFVDLRWTTYAKACLGVTPNPGACNDPGKYCAPTSAPPPTGFTQCIFMKGDRTAECPPEYPEPRLFYGDVKDTRECTPCTCSEPSGGLGCEGILSWYEDAECSEFVASKMLVDGVPPMCADVLSIRALGSMDITFTLDDPGSCTASGGEALGEAVPILPGTFCCAGGPPN